MPTGNLTCLDAAARSPSAKQEPGPNPTPGREKSQPCNTACVARWGCWGFEVGLEICQRPCQMAKLTPSQTPLWKQLPRHGPGTCHFHGTRTDPRSSKRRDAGDSPNRSSPKPSQHHIVTAAERQKRREDGLFCKAHRWQAPNLREWEVVSDAQPARAMRRNVSIQTY